ATPAVFDIAAEAGTLVVGGADLVPAAPRRAGVAVPGVAAPSPLLLALDIRTGREQHRLPADRGGIRWVRITPEGGLLVGAQEGVTSYDLFHGRVLWTSNH